MLVFTGHFSRITSALPGGFQGVRLSIYTCVLYARIPTQKRFCQVMPRVLSHFGKVSIASIQIFLVRSASMLILLLEIPMKTFCSCIIHMNTFLLRTHAFVVSPPKYRHRKPVNLQRPIIKKQRCASLPLNVNKHVDGVHVLAHAQLVNKQGRTKISKGYAHSLSSTMNPPFITNMIIKYHCHKSWGRYLTIV